MFKFVKSAFGKKDWPQNNNKEICFIGRSNVGKSTLINSLTNQKKIARISSSPGRTKLINFFQNKEEVLVDLPGYGYSKTPNKTKKDIVLMLEEYFLYREQLVYIFLLIDAKIGFTKEDLSMLDFLLKLKKNIMILFSKIDKCNQSQKHKIIQQTKTISIDYDSISFLNISSLKGTNINKLRKIIFKIFI